MGEQHGPAAVVSLDELLSAAHPGAWKRRAWPAPLAVTLVIMLVMAFDAVISHSFPGAIGPPAQSVSHIPGLVTIAPDHPAGTMPPPSGGRAAHALRLRAVAAFGADGAGAGDNPQLAQLATDHDPATAWHTDWYTTARFGGLYAGTGLLLDLGGALAVRSLRISLGGGAGTFEVRVGDRAALAALPPVARVSGAMGRVRVALPASTHGRYVLVWFTRLPADDHRTFMASVRNISVRGNR